MPINILRLNHAPSSHPNDRVAFIKALTRPPHLQAEYTHADTFLRAIAAQCLPIMKNHHLSITTLEEYEPNREFIGRNFNNGEVIQLVLRRRDGSWMSFRQVQMVMMHELAHNVQMNHGKAFWVERNRFAGELKRLCDKGYTGEGFWGSGRSLESLQSHAGNMVEVGEGREVEGLCGGTFRSRGRKRKRGRGSLTWREQKDRRIEKKFGKNGVALGEDQHARIKLEIGRRGPLGGKPRVAGSKRGRELRAAAALARFGVKKEEEKLKSEEEEPDYGSGTEDESGADEVGSSRGRTATDINGNRLLDSMGFGMIKICGDEDIDDVNVKKEMEDFDMLESQLLTRQQRPQASPPQPELSPSTTKSPTHSPRVHPGNGSSTSQVDRDKRALYSIPQHPPSPSPPPLPQPTKPKNPVTAKHTPKKQAANRKPAHSPNSATTITSTISPAMRTCPICLTPNNTNLSLNITCTTCAHVLDRRKDPRAWKCVSEACKGSEYVNARDCGRCGACGAVK